MKARGIAVRVGATLAGLLVAWLIALVAIEPTIETHQAEQIAGALGEALHAKAGVAGVDLELVRGALELAGLSVHRDDPVGHLALDVAEVRCELPPLGLALVDGTCRELAVRGGRLEVSAAQLFQLPREQRAPLHVEGLAIDDTQLVFLPSALVPGLGRIAITIDHAQAGPTVLRTPLSWIFALQALRAHVELPGQINVKLGYDGGVLSASGGPLGDTPIALSVAMPAVTSGDGAAELGQLVSLGEQLGGQLVTRRAEAWLKSLH